MRWLAVPLLVLFVAGCEQEITYSGYNMDEYFPFDGERTWEFVSTDTSLPYKLVATLDSAHETYGDDTTQMFKVSYEHVCVNTDTGCTDEWVRTVQWSSNRTYGTRLHSMETAAGLVSYDPPILLTEGQMVVGDHTETITGGTTWTSTLNGLDLCPVDWTSEWGERCAHLTLDDGDGDPAVGEYLSGDYWVITQYNVVGMQLTQDTGVWRLTYATYAYE